MIQNINSLKKKKRNLQFNVNSTQIMFVNYCDKLYKIRQIIDYYLNAKLLLVLMEKFFGVYEQKCASKAIHYLSKIILNKSHKSEYKNYITFVLKIVIHIKLKFTQAMKPNSTIVCQMN